MTLHQYVKENYSAMKYIFGNRKPEIRLWLGLDGLIYHYHGEWSDPQIEYKGEVFSEWDIYDAMYDYMEEDIENGDFSYDCADDDAVYHWIMAHPEAVYNTLDDWITLH